MKEQALKKARLLCLVPIWLLLATVAFAMSGKPSVITYVDATGYQRIYCFGTGTNGHLVVNYWDGFSWQWADQGLPAGVSTVSNPSAITYASAGHQRIYVFAAANTGDLVVNYWDGSAWHWADQGMPAGTQEVYYPSAVTYSSGGKQRIYVFANAQIAPFSYSRLFVNYWDGSSWHWADQGMPAGVSNVYAPSAITYPDSAQQQRMYAFATADTGHLLVNYWDGSAWHWADQGLPPGASSVYGPPAVVTYPNGSQQRIYSFATSSSGNLVVNYWDGSSWHWADHGVPAGVSYLSYPAVITYASGGQQIYAFVEATSGHLDVNYTYGTSWYWADQGLPVGASVVYTPSAITYLSGNQQQIYVFAPANNGDLVVNYWDGSAWHWADQGNR